MRKCIGEVMYFGTFNENYTSRCLITITFFECVKTGSKLNINGFICQWNLASYFKFSFR